jgi:F-type H+-transporting ATPase subunit a
MHFFPTIGEGIWAINLTVTIMTALAALIVLLLGRLAVVGINLRKPRGMQNFFEWLIDFITGLAVDTVGKEHARKYVPLAFTLILYLFISNQMGLIMNINTEFHDPMLGVTAEEMEGKHPVFSWFMSPTANINVTMAMAIAMVGYSHIVGLKRPGKYIKHYFEPFPFFFPVHLVDEGAKFLTLGLRLFGNIFAGEVLISILVGIPMAFGVVPVGAVPLIVWLGYSMFVGTIQAFVFTVLTLVYIGQKLPHDDH